MTKDSDLAMLDDDTIKAAYSKALEPFKFRVMISCKDTCLNPEPDRVQEVYWDPMGAIQQANLMRDQMHETWIDILQLNFHPSHEMNKQNIICLMCGERTEKLEEPCEGV